MYENPPVKLAGDMAEIHCKTLVNPSTQNVLLHGKNKISSIKYFSRYLFHGKDKKDHWCKRQTWYSRSTEKGLEISFCSSFGG